ncbi:hypothetical protein AAHE18_10G213600 [Arachis hypogaea]
MQELRIVKGNVLCQFNKGGFRTMIKPHRRRRVTKLFDRIAIYSELPRQQHRVGAVAGGDSPFSVLYVQTGPDPNRTRHYLKLIPTKKAEIKIAIHKATSQTLAASFTVSLFEVDFLSPLFCYCSESCREKKRNGREFREGPDGEEGDREVTEKEEEKLPCLSHFLCLAPPLSLPRRP